MRTLESIIENGKEESVRSERPKSNIRTIHSELPQRTFSSSFNKRKKTGDETRRSQADLSKASPKPSPKQSPKSGGNKANEDTLFPFPPRCPSPKPASRSSSPKLKRDISTSLKKLSSISNSPKPNLDEDVEKEKEKPEGRKFQEAFN